MSGLTSGGRLFASTEGLLHQRCLLVQSPNGLNLGGGTTPGGNCWIAGRYSTALALQRADEGNLNPLIGLIRAHIVRQTPPRRSIITPPFTPWARRNPLDNVLNLFNTT